MTTQPDEASPPWCVRLISELNAADERATALAKALSPRQLNWAPSPGVWSVGQCLEHLCIANEEYVGAISSSLVHPPLAVVEEIAPGWFGQWFIRTYIEPSSKTRRLRAPRKIRPGAQIEPSILDRFISSNHRARELVHRAGNYDVNRIRFKNPFISVIRFTVGTGLEIVSKHQRRHLLQAERIRESSEFPERGHSA
ncbi:MAG: DinB family protein [Gemmatimonadota bacterium]|nr:DinB family protein [Gemmatimonadota bacterium]